MNIRLIAYAISAVIALGGLGWLYNHIYQNGKAACQAEMQAAINKERVAQRRLVDALKEAQDARETRTRTVTRTIYREADPTGCADSAALPSVLDALRADGSGPATD